MAKRPSLAEGGSLNSSRANVPVLGKGLLGSLPKLNMNVNTTEHSSNRSLNSTKLTIQAAPSRSEAFMDDLQSHSTTDGPQMASRDRKIHIFKAVALPPGFVPSEIILEENDDNVYNDFTVGHSFTESTLCASFASQAIGHRGRARSQSDPFEYLSFRNQSTPMSKAGNSIKQLYGNGMEREGMAETSNTESQHFSWQSESSKASGMSKTEGMWSEVILVITSLIQNQLSLFLAECSHNLVRQRKCIIHFFPGKLYSLLYWLLVLLQSWFTNTNTPCHTHTHTHTHTFPQILTPILFLQYF